MISPGDAILGGLKPAPFDRLPGEKRPRAMETGPVLGVRHKVFFHSLRQNIAEASHLALRGRQCGRFEPRAPEGTAEAVFLAEPAGDFTLDKPHKDGDLLRVSRDHKMEMIG